MSLQTSDYTARVINKIVYQTSVGSMSQRLAQTFLQSEQTSNQQSHKQCHCHLSLGQWGHNLTLWFYQNSPGNTGFQRVELVESCAFFIECQPALRTTVQELLSKTNNDAITQEFHLRKHTEGKWGSTKGHWTFMPIATWSTIVQWQINKQKEGLVVP